jgi:hypothetical protein
MSFEAWGYVHVSCVVLSSVRRGLTMGLTRIQGVIHNTVLIINWNNNNKNNIIIIGKVLSLVSLQALKVRKVIMLSL